MITPAQCRAARSLLDWKQEDLAERSALGIVTIRQFEGRKTTPRRSTLKLLQDTFEEAGIVFIAAGEGTEPADGPGVRLRSGPTP